jgi:hypothetical protein
MRYVVSVMLVVVAVIHLVPVSGALGPGRLTALYGIPFDDPNLLILARHRAVLFGVLGALLLVAAFRPELQMAAFAAGFVSVASFLWLAASTGSYNDRLSRVVVADVVALVCLAIGLVAHLMSSSRPSA